MIGRTDAAATGGSVARVARIAILAQAAYYALTGLWPIVSIDTFQWATGPKLENWLVQTVAALTLAIAAGLAAGILRPAPSTETLTLSLASAGAFAAVDVVFVAQGRIGPIYLADSAVQVVVLGVVGVEALRRARGPAPG